MADENYIQLYRPLIHSQLRVPRSRIRPNNIYRLATYKTVEGEMKRLSGLNETLLFVTGLFEGNIYGLKLNNIMPRFFFQWSQKIVTNTDVLQEEDDIISFSKLTEVRDLRGQFLYENYIRENPILEKPKIPFRTYKLSGIQYISEVYLKKDVLELYYG